MEGLGASLDAYPSRGLIVQCPHCHGYLDNPVTALRKKRKLEGKCIDCGYRMPCPFGPYRFIRCKKCRRKHAAGEKSRRESVV